MIITNVAITAGVVFPDLTLDRVRNWSPDGDFCRMTFLQLGKICWPLDLGSLWVTVTAEVETKPRCPALCCRIPHVPILNVQVRCNVLALVALKW